ncbi:MAG TPA: hypothetical protein VFA89_02670 [Terriglobales bacterium]|nr:hypothetical protein [Terriglobales bacterium]
MKHETRMLMLSAALAAFMLPAAAQTSTPDPAQPPVQQNKMKPGQRAENQQDRISRGIADGELTPGEASKLESDEAKINREAARMKAANGGKLSAADREKLQRQQNYMSHQIYKDAHNNRTVSQDPKSEVGKRMDRQQDRIAQGVNSGQLTAGEASRLEKEDAAIGREVQRDRAANGGTLTPAERQKVNRQENHVSKQIYGAKHNNRRTSR